MPSADGGMPILLVSAPAYRAALLQAQLAPILIGAGYRVVAVDLRELNGGRPPETIGELAARVAAMVEREVGGPCRVVGDFIGALVTQELVITRPDLVTSAVFSAVRLEPTRMNRAVHEEIIARIEQAQDIPPRPLALMRAGQLYAPQRLTDDGHLAAALGTIGVLPTEVAAEAGVLRMSLAYEVQPRRLSTITRPCLVLGFQYDAVTPPHQARQVADLIPGGELTIVPCGHGGAVDDPEAIGSTLVRFFGRERVVDSAGRQCID